jgi:hypothetical protein
VTVSSTQGLCNLATDRLSLALLRGAFVRTDGEQLVLYDGNQLVELTRDG